MKESVRIILWCFILFLVMVSVLSVVTCAEFRKNAQQSVLYPVGMLAFSLSVSFLSLFCRLTQTRGYYFRILPDDTLSDGSTRRGPGVLNRRGFSIFGFLILLPDSIFFVSVPGESSDVLFVAFLLHHFCFRSLLSCFVTFLSFSFKAFISLKCPFFSFFFFPFPV